MADDENISFARDIEEAAKAIRTASDLLDGLPNHLMARVEAIPATQYIDRGLFHALMKLSEDIRKEAE